MKLANTFIVANLTCAFLCIYVGSYWVAAFNTVVAIFVYCANWWMKNND